MAQLLSRLAAFSPAAATVLGSLIALVIQLFLPSYLSPSEYSIFALAWSTGQVLVIVSYEWLRCGLLRYAGTSCRTRYIGTLSYMYAAVSISLIAIAIIIALVPVPVIGGGVAALAVVYAIAQGLFDGRQTEARARLLSWNFSVVLALRCVFSVLFVLSVAWYSGRGWIAFLALVVSFLVVLMAFDIRRLRGAFKPRLDRSVLIEVARLGGGLASAVAMTTMMYLAAKWGGAAAVGAGGAAGFILAVDLAQRAVAVPASAINIVSVPYSVARYDATTDRGERDRILSRHLLITLAVVVPASATFYFAHPFVFAIVPAGYHGSFSSTIAVACACAGLVAFKVFGLDTVQMVRADGKWAMWSALAGLLVCAAILAFNLVGASVGVIALLCGLGVSVAIGVGRLDLWSVHAWNGKDVAAVSIGGFCLFLGYLVGMDSPYSAFSILVISIITYFAVLLVFDFAGIRSVFGQTHLKVRGF